MIYLRCLRCLREFEKWSEVEKIGKNRGKLGKIAVPESPFIYYLQLRRKMVHIIINLHPAKCELSAIRQVNQVALKWVCMTESTDKEAENEQKKSDSRNVQLILLHILREIRV